jgi:hypothetical protein
MKKLFLIIVLLCGTTHADDYKSAQRLAAGDVISAEVFNDILDRIELTLKAISTTEMIGTWTVTWKTCVNGGPGNCSSLNVGSGWSSAVDSLYRERTDEWVISDDEDDTVSVSMQKCFSGAVSGAYYNDPCVARLAVDSGIMLLGTISGAGVSASTQHTEMYNIKRISDSQFTVWRLNSGSNSFVSFTLNKKALPPEAPTSLTATIDEATVSLSWTANDEDVTSYSIHTKDAADGTFKELNTSTTNAFTETLAAGVTRWYRVFTVNSDGTSLGSNVVRVTNPATE